jgi:hypothetical protein
LRPPYFVASINGVSDRLVIEGVWLDLLRFELGPCNCRVPVSADAQEEPEPGNAAIKSVQQAAYRALINLGNGHLESQGRQLRLVPGMQVNAEIHLGTRSVLEYLLSPVQKVAHEAGRER